MRPMAAPAAWAACALVLLLAGCGDPPQRTVEVAGETVVLEEPAAAGTGFVSGIVGDDALYPLPGATVRIVGFNLSAVTDDRGNFLLQDVPPGIYIVEGSKKDHASSQTTVDVTSEKVAKAVLLLKRVPPTDPYHLTFRHQGFVQLSGATYRGNANTSFEFQVDPATPHTVVVESSWEGTFLATGQEPPLMYSIQHLSGQTIEAGLAPNPFVLHLDAKVFPPGAGMYRVTIRPNQPEPVTWQASSQDFVTVFYNAAAPADWSILAGSA